MANDPIEPGGDSPNPEGSLRKRFEEIEKEEIAKPPAPEIPTNDDIRSNAFASPIESMASPENPEHKELNSDEARLIELERQIEEAYAQQRDHASGIKTEYDAKMQDLEARLQKMREDREGKKSTEMKQIQITAADTRGLGIGLSIAYTFIGMPLCGALLGWLLDRFLHSNFFLGVMTIIGVALGLTYTIILLNRTTKRP